MKYLHGTWKLAYCTGLTINPRLIGFIHFTLATSADVWWAYCCKISGVHHPWGCYTLMPVKVSHWSFITLRNWNEKMLRSSRLYKNLFASSWLCEAVAAEFQNKTGNRIVYQRDCNCKIHNLPPSLMASLSKWTWIEVNRQRIPKMYKKILHLIKGFLLLKIECIYLSINYAIGSMCRFLGAWGLIHSVFIYSQTWFCAFSMAVFQSYHSGNASQMRKGMVIELCSKPPMTEFLSSTRCGRFIMVGQRVEIQVLPPEVLVWLAIFLPGWWVSWRCANFTCSHHIQWAHFRRAADSTGGFKGRVVNESSWSLCTEAPPPH